jgi:hypothetical protein
MPKNLKSPEGNAGKFRAAEGNAGKFRATEGNHGVLRADEDDVEGHTSLRTRGE